MNADRDLIRHAAEFKRAMDGHHYEMTDEGIYLNKPRVHIQGEYFYDTNGEDHGSSLNLITTQGFTHLLAVALGGVAAAPIWYLAIFSGAYTPVDGLTAATFAAAATEITSTSNGYSELTRQVWTPAAPAAAGAISNVSETVNNKAVFSIVTTTAVTIRGAALLSSAVRGGTDGVLISASRFRDSGGDPVDRVHYNSDKFNLGYRVNLRPE